MTPYEKLTETYQVFKYLQPIKVLPLSYGKFFSAWVDGDKIQVMSDDTLNCEDGRKVAASLIDSLNEIGFFNTVKGEQCTVILQP